MCHGDSRGFPLFEQGVTRCNNGEHSGFMTSTFARSASADETAVGSLQPRLAPTQGMAPAAYLRILLVMAPAPIRGFRCRQSEASCFGRMTGGPLD
jgi:hypothetical protein